MPLTKLTARQLSPNPHRAFRLFNDFTNIPQNTNSGSDGLRVTGSGVQLFSPDTNSRIGILQFDSGPSATAVHGVMTPLMTCMILGGGEARFDCSIQLPILSNAAQAYNVLAGFISAFSGVSNDACAFTYDSESSLYAGGLTWRTITASNGTGVIGGNSGVTVATDWTRLTVVVNANATSVQFFINGVLVDTRTTNIPVGRFIGFGILFQKRIGTTARRCNVDWLSCEIDFTNNRV